MVGGNRSIFGFLSRLFFGENALLGWHFTKKEASEGPGPLDACHRGK